MPPPSWPCAAVTEGGAAWSPITVDNGSGPAAAGVSVRRSGLPTTVPVSALREPDTPEPGGVAHHRCSPRAATIGSRPDGGFRPGFRRPVPGRDAASLGDLSGHPAQHDIDAQGHLRWRLHSCAGRRTRLTQDAVLPGQNSYYRFRANRTGGTYFGTTRTVCDHVVKLGLYGTAGGVPAAVNPASDSLPVHTLDGSTVVGDRDGRSEATVARYAGCGCG